MASAEAEETQARAVEAEKREIAATAKLKAQEFETELATLIKLLEPEHEGNWSPIVGQVHIEAGYEGAIAAALGDDLDAAGDESAPALLAPDQGRRHRPGSALRRRAAQ